jgi:hypothetical protein
MHRIEEIHFLEKEKLFFYNGETTLLDKMTSRMQGAEC